MRYFRGVIVTLAVLAGLAVLAIAIGTLWLNTYVHSDAFKTEVESRASQALGGTVQIQSIDFDIFHGVKLEGVVYVKNAGVHVTVERVDCAYAWKELIHRGLKLTAVTLDQPVVEVHGLVMTDMPPSKPADATAAPPSAGAGQKTVTPFQFVLDRVNVKDGAVSLIDQTGASVVELKGVDAEAGTSDNFAGSDTKGTLKIADLLWPPNFHITNFSAPFLQSDGDVQIGVGPFTAAAYGGNIAGGFALKVDVGPDCTHPLASPIVSSILDLNAKGLDAAQLTAATISNSSAKLSGSLDLQSKWRGVESGVLDGEGDAQLTNGKLAGVRILHELSKVLRLKELDAPLITSAKTHFLVQNQETKFIGLQLDSPNFQISGDGTVDFKGNLNATLVLNLTRDAMAKLPKTAAASFVQKQDGTGSIAFQVTGTTAHPQTDLAERLLMQNTKIQNAIDKALNKYFH